MQQTSYLCSLPRHLLYKILGYTDPFPENYLKYAEVSKLFYEICTSKSAWARFRPPKFYFLNNSAFLKHYHDPRSGYQKYLIERQVYSLEERRLSLQQSPADPSGSAKNDVRVERMFTDPLFEVYQNNARIKPLLAFAVGHADFVNVCTCCIYGRVEPNLMLNYHPHLLVSDVGSVASSAGFISFPTDAWDQLSRFLKMGAGIDHEVMHHLHLTYSRWTEIEDPKYLRYGFAEPNLRYRKSAALAVLKTRPQILPVFLRGPIASREVLIAAAECRTRENLYELIDPRLKKDRRFMLKFFCADGWQIRYANEKDDHEYVVAAFKSFCNRKLLRNVTLRSREIALAAISFDAQLYWDFEYRDDEFNKLAMAANCTLWDIIQSAELAPIAAAQDYRCWQEVRKQYEVPAPSVRRLNGYRREQPGVLVARRRQIVIEEWVLEHSEFYKLWPRHVRFAEYRVDV